MNPYIKQLGHLQSLNSSLTFSYKNLKPGFYWSMIPMLSVLTGVNGCGKTAALEAILNAAHLLIYPEQTKQQNILNLTFRSDIDISKIQIDTHTPTFYNNGLSTNLGKNSEEDQKKVFDKQFDDLECYDTAQRYKTKYQPKFSDTKQIYDRILKPFEDSLEPSNPSSINIYQTEIRNKLKTAFAHDYKYTIHIHSLSSIESYLKHLGTASALKHVNKFLNDEGYKYQLSDNCIRNNTYTLQLEDPSDKKITNNQKWIQPSPGEKLQLLFLLWIYHYTTNEQHRFAGPAILLLDESDAHFHPGLVREFIKVIANTLVCKYKIQVIMTTHNPTTVSFLPKECIFIVSSNGVAPVNSKREAIQLLTSNFVYVNEPFRLVWVQTVHNVQFYMNCYTQLMKMGFLSQLLNQDIQLTFKPYDKERNLVIKVVDESTKNVTLQDFIFGIVDGSDQLNDNSRQLPNNIQVLKRHSIENYLLDPIHIYYWLQLRHTDFFNILLQGLDNKLQKSVIPDDLHDLIKHQDAQKIMQTIIDIVSNKLIERLQYIVDNSSDPVNLQKITDEFYKELYNSKISTTDTLDSKHTLKLRKKISEITVRLLENKLLNPSAKLIDNCTVIKLIISDTNIIELKYYDVLLRIKGCDLELTYRTLDPSLKTSEMLMSSILPFEDLVTIYISLLTPIIVINGKLVNKKLFEIVKGQTSIYPTIKIHPHIQSYLFSDPNVFSVGMSPGNRYQIHIGLYDKDLKTDQKIKNEVGGEPDDFIFEYKSRDKAKYVNESGTAMCVINDSKYERQDTHDTSGVLSFLILTEPSIYRLITNFHVFAEPHGELKHQELIRYSKYSRLMKNINIKAAIQCDGHKCSYDYIYENGEYSADNDVGYTKPTHIDEQKLTLIFNGTIQHAENLLDMYLQDKHKYSIEIKSYRSIITGVLEGTETYRESSSKTSFLDIQYVDSSSEDSDDESKETNLLKDHLKIVFDDQRMITLNGDSGSPVYITNKETQESNLIGIHRGKFDDIGLVVRLDRILDFFESNLHLPIGHVWRIFKFVET